MAPDTLIKFLFYSILFYYLNHHQTLLRRRSVMGTIGIQYCRKANKYQAITVRPSKLTLRSFDIIAPVMFSTLYLSGVAVVCNAILASFKASMMVNNKDNRVYVSELSV